uniref:VASt domain-containing protein n=1 Tax=Macrostomum lignano TaxID=282301 RepID=A0A1I8JAC6_9PLAT
MAACIKTESIVRSDSSPIFYVGEQSTTTTGSSCQFRSIAWKPSIECTKWYPIILQTKAPMELFRGIAERPELDHPSCRHDSRDAVSVQFHPDSCDKELFHSLRQVEKGLSVKLNEIQDARPLARLTKPAHQHANDVLEFVPQQWLAIKPAYPCATIRISNDHPHGKEVSISDFKGVSGTYQMTVQATSLYCPKGCLVWRITFAVRSLTLIESSDNMLQRLDMFKGVLAHLPATKSAIRSRSPSPTSTCEQEEANEQSLQNSSQVTPAKSPAKRRSTTTVSKKSTTSNAAPASIEPPPKKQVRKRSGAKQQNNSAEAGADGTDWVEAPPAKILVSTPASGTRVASKETAFLKRAAADATTASVSSSDDSYSSSDDE